MGCWNYFILIIYVLGFASGMQIRDFSQSVFKADNNLEKTKETVADSDKTAMANKIAASEQDSANIQGKKSEADTTDITVYKYSSDGLPASCERYKEEKLDGIYQFDYLNNGYCIYYKNADSYGKWSKMFKVEELSHAPGVKLTFEVRDGFRKIPSLVIEYRPDVDNWFTLYYDDEIYTYPISINNIVYYRQTDEKNGSLITACDPQTTSDVFTIISKSVNEKSKLFSSFNLTLLFGYNYADYLNLINNVENGMILFE